MPKIIHDFFPEENNHNQNIDNTYLYHYSNIDAVINILETEQIWLSHVSQMNDSSEGKLILEKASNIHNASIYYHMLLKNYYLCSFSGYGNLLSQWRGYGDVNIGFSRDELVSTLRFIEDADGEVLDTSGVQFTGCDYINVDDKDFDDIVEETKNKLLHLVDIDKIDLQRKLLGIGSVCFSLKHSGFRQESESRIIAYLWNRKPFEIKGKKYIKFRFDTNVIRRIVIGPSKDQTEKTKKIIEYLNKNKKYSKVEVYYSGIPFSGV